LISQKILNLKAFADPETNVPWKASVIDVSAEVLCVSQFTLYAKTVKNKPDFHAAMGADSSRAMYSSFLEKMGVIYAPEKIKDGQFGAMMSVALTNEGPVTFTLESRTPSSLPTAIPSSFNTRSNTPSMEAERKKAEKALRKAEWEKKATKAGLETPAQAT